MAEADVRPVTHRQLTELLIKHAGVHEGLWALTLEFGFAAANVPIAEHDGSLAIKPTGMVSVNKVAIQRFDSPTPLTVDAAEVNPATPTV